MEADGGFWNHGFRGWVRMGLEREEVGEGQVSRERTGKSVLRLGFALVVGAAKGFPADRKTLWRGWGDVWGGR